MSKSYEKAVLVQTDQLRKVEMQSIEINHNISNIAYAQSCQSDSLDKAGKVLNNLLSNIDSKEAEPNVGIDKKLIKKMQLTPQEEKEIETKHLLKLTDRVEYDGNYSNYEKYINENNIDLSTDPILQMLSIKDIQSGLSKYHNEFGKISWNTCDYCAIALITVIAVIIEYAVVKIPWRYSEVTDPSTGKKVPKFDRVKFKESSGEEGCEGSPLTKLIAIQFNKIENAYTKDEKGNIQYNKDLYGLMLKVQKYCEQVSKIKYTDEGGTERKGVPFDTSSNDKKKNIKVAGLRPDTHRVMSLAHDPLWGLIVGLIDYYRGTTTLIDEKGHLAVLYKGYSSKNILENILKEVAHIISDIPTSKGVQVPGITILQLIKTESPVKIVNNSNKEITLTYPDLIRWMYANGYDMKHFITMGVVPGTIELLTRTYYDIINFDDIYNKNKILQHRCKLASMLTTIHSLVTVNVAFKCLLKYKGNPLAINYPEVAMCVKSAICKLHADTERHEWIEKELEKQWNNLMLQDI